MKYENSLNRPKILRFVEDTFAGIWDLLQLLNFTEFMEIQLTTEEYYTLVLDFCMHLTQLPGILII